MIRLSDLEALGFEMRGTKYDSFAKTVNPLTLVGSARATAAKHAEANDGKTFSYVHHGVRWKAKWESGELLAQHWCHLQTMVRGDEAINAYEDEGNVLHLTYFLSFFPSHCACLDVSEETTIKDVRDFIRNFLEAVPSMLREDSACRIRAVSNETKERLKRTAVAVAVWTPRR